MKPLPSIRIQTLNNADVAQNGDYVLYWMIAHRRTRFNFSLQRAVEWSVRLNKPLVIFEALRIGYHWASDRLHRFVLQGMAENRKACSQLPVTYYCYVEPEKHHGQGLFDKLSARACVVVTDAFPCFFLPSLLKLASQKTRFRFEAIDSNGLLPMPSTDHAFPTAYAFRRFLQRELPNHFSDIPAKNPLANLNLPKVTQLPEEILNRWPPATDRILQGRSSDLAALSIDHQVTPVTIDGGAQAAESTLKRFLSQRLHRYADDRNQPDHEVASGLSPYLHFGHISAHEVFTRVAKSEGWTPEAIADSSSGKREGWWGMSPGAESFLDELITWRELGYNMCFHRRDFDRYESLPNWALATLEKHRNDPREFVYSLDEFETSRTHDELWNAAQRQLVRDGKIHNYLRMLWGKKILEWTESPQIALQVMIQLNNKYALDGRNPNSYSGIFWVLGRYDRAWGPERPIYGKIRYMTSESTRRKLKLKNYMKTYAQKDS